MYTCPCCGYEVFPESPGSYDICPICFWEDDLAQLYYPFQAGGANPCHLAESQVNFVQFGACDRVMMKNVRAAGADDKRDPLWFPLWERRVELPNMDAEGTRLRTISSISTLCYWLRG